MDQAEIPFLSVTQLGELIKNREVSPVEVVESYLDRLDSLNDRLYAYLTVCGDQALQSARESERALLRGESRGPCMVCQWQLKTSLKLRASAPRPVRPYSTISFPMKTPPWSPS